MGDRPLLPQPAHRRYFVVFWQGPPHWWDWFLAPEYGHCFLLIWDEVAWLVIQPTLGITEITVPELYEFQHPADWEENAGTHVIECGLEWDERMRAPWVFGPLTCVEVIKGFLGIRRFWLWTPRQLARYLRRRHGQLEKPGEPIQGA